MRSRYSAFCTGNVDYLLSTHHFSESTELMRERIGGTVKTTQWLGLRIIASHSEDDKGEVEFIAGYRDAGGLGFLREHSIFHREENRWYYVSGTHLPSPKLQRNDPCWCDSGKKFKKCCGA